MDEVEVAGCSLDEEVMEGIVFCTEGTLIDAFDLRRRLGPAIARQADIPRALLAESLKPNPAIRTVLRSLQRRNISIAAASTLRSTQTLRDILDVAGLLPLVDVLSGVKVSDSPQIGQPFLRAMNGLGLTPRECTLIVEESHNHFTYRTIGLLRILEVDGPHQVEECLRSDWLNPTIAA